MKAKSRAGRPKGRQRVPYCTSLLPDVKKWLKEQAFVERRPAREILESAIQKYREEETWLS